MRRTLCTLALAALATACVRTSTNPVTGEMDVDVESPAKQGEDWNAKLTGAGEYAAVSGSATAAVLSGRTTVTVQLSGAKPGARHPWFVHEGGCGSGGDIVGDRSAYQPLVVGEDGTATARAELALQLDEARTYHVMVHASQSEMATMVACGDLSD